MKQKNKEDFYYLLTKVYGWCIVMLSSAAISWRLLTWTLTVNQFAFFAAAFVFGRFIQKTAYHDYNAH